MEKKPHRAPCLFIGHGSPMNALEINEFTQQWKACVTWFSQPRAIVVISAHWYTDKTRINNLEQPKLIYDMYGFPKALYDTTYPAKNDLEVGKQIQSLLGNELIIDNAWGLGDIDPHVP